jgi:hypothetical protein
MSGFFWRLDSVCKLIEELVRRIDNIEQNMAALGGENELLKEQVARTSANSLQPPSTVSALNLNILNKYEETRYLLDCWTAGNFVHVVTFPRKSPSNSGRKSR